MKKIIILICASLIISSTKNNLVQAQELKGQISLSGAFALYPMAVTWAQEFRKQHPEVRIDISAGGAGKGITDALSNMVDLGMVSRDINPAEFKKGAYAIAVTKDAVVATASASNPLINDILSKGLKPDVGTNIWITGQYKTWGQAFGVKSAQPLHVYTRSDACGAAEVWAKYFGKKQEDLLGVGVFGDPGLAAAVKKDPLGIGFNNIGYAYDFKTKKQNPGIRVIPIDLNKNGKIDVDESFYDSMTDLINAIANGKYPSPPARDLYLVSLGKPKNPIVIAFIKYILTDGQKLVNQTGYIKLAPENLTNELAKIN